MGSAVDREVLELLAKVTDVQQGLPGFLEVLMKVCENNIKCLCFSFLCIEIPAECPAPLLRVSTVQDAGARWGCRPG